jgi:hypothetical protein
MAAHALMDLKASPVHLGGHDGLLRKKRRPIAPTGDDAVSSGFNWG